jgi:hypothetical protein
MLRDIAHSPPWVIEDNGACFIVRDRNEQALAYVYYEREPRRRTAAAGVAQIIAIAVPLD